MTGDLHTRSFDLDLELRDDGDTVTAEGLILPYNRETEIFEVRPNGPISYRESMLPRCAERNFRAPYRIALAYGHSDAFDQRLGHVTELRESAEGLIGMFRLDRSRAEHARDVLTGSHSGLSVSFMSLIPKPLSERPGEHIIRRSIHIGHVAAVADPAYEDARMTLVRAQVGGGEQTANEAEHAALQAQQRDLLAWLAVARELPAGYAP